MTSKLDSIQCVDEKLKAWVGLGLSLKRIASELGKLGVKVTDMTVHRRIRALGLVIQNAPIASRTGEGAWLSEFRGEIVRLADAGKTYAEIWNCLASSHPGRPQFQRELGRDAKTSALAAWVHLERKRNTRPRRLSLLDALSSDYVPTPRHTVAAAQAGVVTRSQRVPADRTVVRLGREVAQESADTPHTFAPLRPNLSASESEAPRFSIAARRQETDAMRLAQRAQEDNATSQEDKEKAAKLRERFKTT